MKLCNMNGPSESEVESLLMSPCWGPAQNGSQDQYLLEGHKLLLETDIDSLPSDTEQKNSLDVLDNFLLSSSSLSALSDLKPLPPFTGYTGHLSINGISGHHYHAIAQRLPEESNNNYIQSAYHSTNISLTTEGSTAIQLAAATSMIGSNVNSGVNNDTSGGIIGSSSHSSTTEHNIVSSSTCLSENVLTPDADACLSDVKLFSDSQLENKLYTVAENCVISGESISNTGGVGSDCSIPDDHGPPSENTSVRIYTDSKDLTEYVDMNSIDDIAAIIGSAIADTTVSNQIDKEDGHDTRDSWMDLDAWIDGSCVQQENKLVVSQQDSLNDFILPHSPVHTNSSTLQSILTHSYMPLLHNRLQNGPVTMPTIKNEASSSTSFCHQLQLTSPSSSSPPSSVVSTTDNLMVNPRYVTNPHQYQVSVSSMKSDSSIRSPEMVRNFPHTTSITPTGAQKTKRPRSQKKSNQQPGVNINFVGPQQMNTITPSSVGFSTNDISCLLGKEKTVHRCSICNRGFLNKSNIKVHLRTHTGEKPFRCDVCAKAFRQKAHLLKHQQIHKRIGRD